MPNAGNALGEADCVGGATCIPTASAFAGIGAPAGAAKEGGALGEADCGAAETGGDTMPGGLAKDGAHGAAPETCSDGGGLRTDATDVPAATAMAWALVAASVSSTSGSETNPPAHGAAGEEPLPLPVMT